MVEEKKQFDPRADTGEKRPVVVTLAARDVNDKFSDYPSNGLTPRRLARIFRAADAGDVRAQMELYEEMEEKDPHLFSQLQTRKLAVTGLDWEVQPFSEAEEDKQIAEFVSEQLKALDNLDEIMLDALDALGKGISILEIQWGMDQNGANAIKDIEYVHPKKLVWDGFTDELKVCTREFPTGLSFPKNKFVIHSYKARSGHPSRAGILRVVAWMYLFKNYDVKDWVAFCEVFGMPLRLGKYSPSASEEDKLQLMRTLVEIGTDAAGMVPDGTMIEFIESQKTASAQLYERLARYCDEQMSKAILGQTLTADSGGGSYAQSKTHNEVRHDLTVADAKALATTIRRDIIRPLVEYNFGTDCNLPLFVFDCQEAEDQKENVEILKALVCDMGLQVPASHIYKKFNIPKPEAGEEVLHPRQLTGNMTAQEVVEKPLKAQGTDAQQEIDGMVEAANRQAAKIFDAMFEPICKEIDKSTDLKALKNRLTDKKVLKKLLEEMEQPELRDLISQGIYYAELIGRGES